MVIFSVILVLGGCFDVAQHVTKNSSGEIVSFVRFTFDKSLFSITEQMSGEPVDYSTMLTDADLTENDFLGSLPAGIHAVYEAVDTSARYGFNLRMQMTERQARAPFRSVAAISPDDALLNSTFFPFLLDGGVVIPFEGIADADDESEPFLSSALYTVSIGKPLMRTIRAVHVTVPGTPISAANRIDVPITDYEDYNLIEIPLSEFMGEGTRLVVVVP